MGIARRFVVEQLAQPGTGTVLGFPSAWYLVKIHGSKIRSFSTE
jgi:hypothetical protein